MRRTTACPVHYVSSDGQVSLQRFHKLDKYLVLSGIRLLEEFWSIRWMLDIDPSPQLVGCNPKKTLALHGLAFSTHITVPCS